MQNVLASIAQSAPAIAMLGMFACLIGGVAALRCRDAKRGGLMLLMAVVLLVNVLIWTM